jgi:hypothetical protein
VKCELQNSTREAGACTYRPDDRSRIVILVRITLESPESIVGRAICILFVSLLKWETIRSWAISSDIPIFWGPSKTWFLPLLPTLSYSISSYFVETSDANWRWRAQAPFWCHSEYRFRSWDAYARFSIRISEQIDSSSFLHFPLTQGEKMQSIHLIFSFEANIRQMWYAFTSYKVSQKSLQPIRFRELAEIIYQLINIYLDILSTICITPV